ncbi:MAG: protein kinase [Acidobacteriota bacterium]
MTPDPGRTLSHYRLLEKIGEGGMGVVFRALDTRLNRHVAIKVLHPLQTSDPKRKKQLIREARTAAALNHPSVCTIHEIGEVPRAHAQPDIPADSPYVVMEFVRGESLHVRLERLGALPLQQLFDLALQVAEGLREAHAHRVIHRDLKPQNLLVTPEGRLKILDFGLAIAMRPALSRRESSDEPTISWDRYEEGKVAGTVPYMSPEQALGKELGTRSDLFSFGSILYEMATGRKPFLDDTNTGILAKILQSEPESILGLRPDLPAGMEQVVLRCLRKDPADRYGDTGELVAALREVQQANASGRLPTVADRVSSDSDAVEHPSEISRNTIAVLPFTVRGSEAFGYLGEGIVDLLSTKLDGAGDLRAVDSHALLCCLEIETLDPGSGREIALRFGAGQFVLGNILEIGGHVHIHAALYDAAEPKIISKSEVEGPATEIFNLVDRLTAELVAGRQGGPEMRLTRIAATTTSSFPALKAYLNGEREMRALRRELAVPAFQTAVKEDPTFGLAWYRLAVASLWSQRPETAWEAARRAVQHSHRLNQRDRSLLEAFNALLRGANDEAERLYRSIVGTFPNDVEAWFQLGELLFHHAPKRGTPLRKSRPIWKRILELAPDHINALVHLGAIAAIRRIGTS